MWWESFAQSLQCVVSSTSCARRPRGVVRLRSPMVLSTHGSGRARGERAIDVTDLRYCDRASAQEEKQKEAAQRET